MENYWVTIKEVLSEIAAVLVAITPLALGIMAFYQWKMNRKISKVEKNTDGLVSHLVVSKDAEIKSTGELQKEIGKAEATAEAKIEIDKLNKDSNPEK